MKNRARDVAMRPWPGLELLEPRLLLSGDGVIDVTQGLPDLQVAIAASFKEPTNALSGTGKIIKVPLEITNIDRRTQTGQTVAVPAVENVTVRVLVRPENGAEDGSADILVGEVTDVNLDGLKVGALKKLTVPVSLTEDVLAGNWRLIVQLDPTKAVTELDEDIASDVLQANNVAQSDLFPVELGRPDLTVSVVSDSKLPSSIVSGTSRQFSVTFKVTNTGNLAMPLATTVPVKITLDSEHNATPVRENSSEDIFEPVSVDVSGLKPGSSVKVTAMVYFPNTVNDKPETEIDVQHFTFHVDADDAVKELDETNNTAQSKSITVDLGAYTIFIEPGANRNLPSKPIISGGGKDLNVTARLHNVGDADFITGTGNFYLLTLIGVPATGGGDIVELSAEEPFVTVEPLAPGQRLSFTNTYQIPINKPGGVFELWYRARFPSVEGGIATEYFQVANDTITIVQGFINLVPSIGAAAKLPAGAVSGNGKVYKLPLDIRNAGNLPTPATSAISVHLSLRNTGEPGTAPISLGDSIPLEIGTIGAGKTKRMTVSYTIPGGLGLEELDPARFVLVAELEDTDTLEELITLDNTTESETEFQVIRGNPDLVPVLPEDLELPTEVLGGAGQKFVLPLTIKNEGNIAVADDTTALVRVLATPVGGGAPVLVGESEVDFSKFKKDGAKKVNLAVTLSSVLPSGDYKLSVIVDPDGEIDELDNENNLVEAGPTIHVTQGLVDFAAALDGTALAAQVTAGDGSTITLPLTITNVGNLATQKNQVIDVRVFLVNPADAAETAVATISGVKVGNLAENAARTFELKTSLPVSVLSGTYELRAEVDAGRDVVETGDDLATGANGANNTAIATGALVNVLRRGANLGIAFGEGLVLPESVLSGDGSRIALPLLISNLGDLAVPKGKKVNLRIHAHNQADGDLGANDVLLRELLNLNLGGLGAEGSRVLNTDVTLPAGMGPGQFVLIVTIDSGNALEELDEADNKVATGPLSAGG